MKQIAIALDQLINALLGGMADETLSARACRCQIQGKWSHRPRTMIDRLFFWQERHCYQSYLAEFERKHLPSHYRS